MPEVSAAAKAGFSRRGANESVSLSFPLFLGVAVALVLAYLFLRNSGTDTPTYQDQETKVIGMHDYSGMLTGGMGDHFLPPENHCAGVVTLPVRYPNRVGHNGTCLINQGFGGLYASNPQTNMWMFTPPSEVQI